MSASVRGGNADAMQERNRSLVLQILARNDVFTRVQISDLMGLQQASISKIIAEFIEEGLVTEVGSVEGRKGRRSIGISLNSEKIKTIAIALSREYYQIGLSDVKGNFYEKQKISTQHKSVSDIVKMIHQDIDIMLKIHADISAIGIAVPGPYLRDEGRIVIIADYPGWDSVDFSTEFMNKYDIPVCIEHDANAGALAEWQYGHNDHDGVLLHMIAGSGIGAGIIENGHIVTGHKGIAGEIGHMSIAFDGPKCSCGNSGCLRLYCSAPSFLKHVKEGLKEHPESELFRLTDFTLDDIFSLSDKGDTYCTNCVKNVARYLGIGIVNCVYLYNANNIIISDKMVRGGEILLQKIKETVKSILLPVLYQDLSIRYSEFGEDTILYGAAAIAGNLILNNYGLISSKSKKRE